MADTPTASAAKAEEILGELERAVNGAQEEVAGSSDQIHLEKQRVLLRELFDDLKSIKERYEELVKGKSTEEQIAQIKAQAGLQ